MPRKHQCLHRMATVPVQVRIPEETVKEIDRLGVEGRFTSISEVIETIVVLYRERTHAGFL